MDNAGHIAFSVVMTALLAGVGMVLKRIGSIQDSHASVFSHLITEITLPATILHVLATHQFHPKDLVLAGLMFGSEMVVLGLAWIVGKAMHLDRTRMAALLLSSAFSNSALLGYPMADIVFNHDARAMIEAVVISEMGAGPAIFMVGVMVAAYYCGGSGAERPSQLRLMTGYFRSPIFCSVVIGLALSLSGLPVRFLWLADLLDTLEPMADANTFLVVLIVGISLRFEGMRPLVGVIAAAITLKLILQPIFASLPTLAMSIDQQTRQVLILQAAMPSALMGAALVQRFGGDPHSASAVSMANTLASAVTVIVMLAVL
jgi:predicted permease